MSEIVKKCKIHGDLTLSEVRKDGHLFRCTECRKLRDKESYERNKFKRIATSVRWKQQNKGDYNEWMKEDRKKFPEKYKKYEENYIEKHGREKMRKQEVARIHKLSVEEYDAMFVKQNNLCLICNKEEKRVGRSGVIMPLCVDHCHTCEDNGNYVIRGLLCHNCNKGIGNFLDDVTLLQKAIDYLNKHKHN